MLGLFACTLYQAYLTAQKQGIGKWLGIGAIPRWFHTGVVAAKDRGVPAGGPFAEISSQDSAGKVLGVLVNRGPRITVPRIVGTTTVLAAFRARFPQAFAVVVGQSLTPSLFALRNASGTIAFTHC